MLGKYIDKAMTSPLMAALSTDGDPIQAYNQQKQNLSLLGKQKQQELLRNCSSLLAEKLLKGPMVLTTMKMVSVCFLALRKLRKNRKQ